VDEEENGHASIELHQTRRRGHRGRRRAGRRGGAEHRYARHGGGAGIALGIIGTMLAGVAIASAQPAYAAPPDYYYQPRGYDTAPAYYGPPAGYYQPSPYGYYR
jgi:hypothetical protein